MSKKLKLIIIIAAALVVLTVIVIIGLKSETITSIKEKSETTIEDMNDLESDYYYVLENDFYKKASIKDYTFEGKEINEDGSSDRAIFFDIESEDIPTVTSNNPLLFISKTTIPEEFVFERFRDDGISIGLANLIKDESNHYFFPIVDKETDDYKSYVDMKSDVSSVTKLDTSRLYIDQVGDMKVNKDSVTDGGVIKGLDKDKDYIATFYTGTLYQDYKVRSNIHTFTTMEEIKSYDFEFLHSNVIKVNIPKYFKSGYYLVNGIGFIRYLADADIGKSDINYNNPMIIVDEYGFVIYDPSDESYEGISEEQAIANSKVGTVEPGGV